ncbi:GNAT family N-acetyltransferase [Caldivirga maquilingensis]|uniref:GCN5-related N-acetyltransferase n=1 Tax=Caldivirga maquilingensis (strain ATCC 700844 / DSM 13496 / JCM 10307 / IC-167) TaxID=397948 RepID=A8MBD0_CALMQ|nr:GNAT family N-acetyltransferase [Caldivirga maquilingensis]ABW01220.1 GCN5-related N-acetyltransferase [Caldivirga maquilingensis IC-167]
MVKVRKAEEKDLENVVELVVRLKRLNSEFDPLLKVRDDVYVQVKNWISGYLNNKGKLLLVAESDDGRVIGALVSEVRERLFYEPRMEGVIMDFYIMPEFRRRGIGKMMMDEAIRMLREMGAHVISAEFPAQNQISVAFYRKYGFRPMTNVYVKET